MSCWRLQRERGRGLRASSTRPSSGPSVALCVMANRLAAGQQVFPGWTARRRDRAHHMVSVNSEGRGKGLSLGIPVRRKLQVLLRSRSNIFLPRKRQTMLPVRYMRYASKRITDGTRCGRRRRGTSVLLHLFRRAHVPFSINTHFARPVTAVTLIGCTSRFSTSTGPASARGPARSN